MTSKPKTRKPAHPLRIADLTFPDKDAAYEYFRDAVSFHPCDTPMEGQLAARFMALITRHPDAEAKVGPGIDHLLVSIGSFQVPELRLSRVDGTLDNISVRKCIYGAPSPRVAVMRLMRTEVRKDVRRARQAWFRENRHDSDPTRARCAVSGQYISADRGHMDHIPPMTFEVIALTFLMHKGVPFAEVEIEAGEPGQMSRMADRALAGEWRDWHAQLARLRFISNAHNDADEALVRLRREGLRIPLEGRKSAFDLYETAA